MQTFSQAHLSREWKHSTDIYPAVEVYFIINKRLLFSLGSLSNQTTSTEAKTWSESVTSRLCNHFWIMQSHYAWKCVLTILELNWNQRLGQNWTFAMICSRRPHNCARKNENVFKCQKKWKMYVQCVQKYFFSLSNMQICGFLLPSSSWLLKLAIVFQ